MIIKKTQFQVNLEQMVSDLNEVLKMQCWLEWPEGSDKVANQISLKHRPGREDWLDGIGSLKDKQGTVLAEEKDFTEWNKLLPDYTRTVLETLQYSEGVKFGRVRYMRQRPKSDEVFTQRGDSNRWLLGSARTFLGTHRAAWTALL